MSLEKRRWKTGLDAGVKGPLESRCSDGQSQRGVQGLRNEQGGGRVGHSARLLPRKSSGQMKITLRMKQEGGVGEAAFLAVPGIATRWRACLSHRLSLTCQVTRSLLQMPTEQLQQKDQQILLLLEEKEMLFRDMTECSALLPEDCSPTHSCRTLFRSNTEEALKGGPLMKSAINEGNLHSASPPHPPTVVCTLALSTIEHFFSLFRSTKYRKQPKTCFALVNYYQVSILLTISQVQK